MKLKRLLSMALALLLSTGAAAAEGFAPALDPDTACEITVVGTYSNFEALEAEFVAFNDYYPDVELTYLKLDDYDGTISTAVSGESAPDIYFMYPWMAGRSEFDAAFAHAEDLSAPELGLDLDCLREGLLFRDESGALPMVPVFSTTYGMLVNEDLFEAADVAVPETYADLLDACAKLREAGYANPILGYNDSGSLLNVFSTPEFYASIDGDSEAVAALNSLEPAGGEYLRPTLEATARFIADGCVDLSACEAELPDSYNGVILRFFEGDVPMMFCSGDTVSGTQKREAQSEAFTAHPFRYSFHPVPTTGGIYYADMPSVQFAVNRESADLAVVNEFMRFLITTEQLGEMARIKRLITPCKDMTLDSIYASFGEVDASRRIFTQALGVLDDVTIQKRRAVFAVGNGTMTIDEAVAAYGSISE